MSSKVLNFRLKHAFFVVLCFALITSCNNMPTDLQKRKDDINSRLEELTRREENSSGLDYKQLTQDYIDLKGQIVDYASECNRRGIAKENEELIRRLDETISKFKALTDETEVAIEETNNCTICGKKITGRGYSEVSDGFWEPCQETYQCFICSPSCGKQSTRNLENVLEEHGINSSIIHDNNSYQTRGDGRVYEDKPCSLCQGTGVESGRNIATGEIESRTCPMCDGRGVRSY
jgi:hypothetical protein